MTKKIFLLVFIIFLSVVLASIYGFFHNRISYSISSEYFTKFKIQQFEHVYSTIHSPRIKAVIIGVLSTWWFGLLIGLIIGINGFSQSTTKKMWKSSYSAILITVGIAIGFGILGVLVGRFIISTIDLNWNIPTEVNNKKNFLIAGTMHNFSYLGGIIGLIFGVKYQLKIKKANAQQRL